MSKTMVQDLLSVEVFATRGEMGKVAALDIEASISKQINTKGCCNIIFAAAPSQNDVLASLAASKQINWGKVHAFHMDEYIGIDANAPQGFANFLRRTLFDKANPGKVEYLDSTANPKE